MTLHKWDASIGETATYEEVSLPEEDLEEKQLRSTLAQNPSVIDDELFIVDEEFSHWDDSQRSVDLLALRRSDDDEYHASLVVVELKRDESRDAELQALRYAAMCSVMRFEDILDVHSNYLADADEDPEEFRSEARQAIEDFLEWEELASSGEDEVLIGNRPEIMIVAKEFNTELTTTVLHLIEEYGLPIECVSLGLYNIEDTLFLHSRQVLPLPEAEEYQVKKRQKEDQNKQASSRSRRTSRILADEGIIEVGTPIEFVGEEVPEDVDDQMLNAEFGDPPTGNKNVQWKYDGRHYSLSTLTEKLRDDHGFDLPGGGLNGYWFWAIKSDSDQPPLRKKAKAIE